MRAACRRGQPHHRCRRCRAAAGGSERSRGRQLRQAWRVSKEPFTIAAIQAAPIPEEHAFKREYLPGELDWINPRQSAIVDPDGKLLAAPAAEEETILYAEVDPAALAGPRYQLDVAGHDGRPDVFELIVNRTPHPMVETIYEWDALDEELEEE